MLVVERLLLAAVVVFSGLVGFEALGIKPPADRFPLFVTGTTAMLAVVALVRSFATPLTGPIAEPGRARYVAGCGAGLVAYAVAMSVNYLAATVVFLLLGYLLLMPERSRKSVMVASAVAIATTGFTWLCFAYWLGVNLPR